VTSLLDEAIEAWEDARNGVISEAENIPAARYDFSPAEGVRSVGELVAHILEVSELMVGELTRGDTDLHRAPWPELLEMHASNVKDLREKDDLLAAAQKTLETGTKRFREAGELHMLQMIKRFDGELGTRLAWMHHGISQEMYHRGQLTLYARLLGIEPALTKRIRGA
jgi:uncharacterized damage-inducible protein DinB